MEQLRADEAAESDAMAARPRGGLALCLSGGGYRAALFHLGALIRLRELGLLHRAELISSVSGGSIVSAWLATRYLRSRIGPDESFGRWCEDARRFREVVIEPFRRFVARDIRTTPVLRTLPYNWLWPTRRVRLLQRAYAGQFGDATLADLPETPRFVFCASDLTFGVNWEFSRERVGDYMAGYLRAPMRITLAEAVAASSSFPPVFGPVRFRADAEDFVDGKHRGPDAEELRSRIDLSDGGVYDNLAMEPSLRRYSTVLVSDAGAPFAFEARRGYVRRLMRYTEVVGNQARALRKRLFYASRHYGAFDGVLWGLEGPFVDGAAGYGQALVAATIGRVRTDLDRFLDDEFEILVNHGYFMCNNALLGRRRILPQTPPPARWPFARMADPAVVRNALRFSDARVFHGRWLSAQ